MGSAGALTHGMDGYDVMLPSLPLTGRSISPGSPQPWSIPLRCRPDCPRNAFRRGHWRLNAARCPQCFCVICDATASSCGEWGAGDRTEDHCNADVADAEAMRERRRRRRERRETERSREWAHGPGERPLRAVANRDKSRNAGAVVRMRRRRTAEATTTPSDSDRSAGDVPDGLRRRGVHPGDGRTGRGEGAVAERGNAFLALMAAQRARQRVHAGTKRPRGADPVAPRAGPLPDMLARRSARDANASGSEAARRPRPASHQGEGSTTAISRSSRGRLTAAAWKEGSVEGDLTDDAGAGDATGKTVADDVVHASAGPGAPGAVGFSSRGQRTLATSGADSAAAGALAGVGRFNSDASAAGMRMAELSGVARESQRENAGAIGAEGGRRAMKEESWRIGPVKVSDDEVRIVSWVLRRGGRAPVDLMGHERGKAVVETGGEVRGGETAPDMQGEVDGRGGEGREGAGSAIFGERGACRMGMELAGAAGATIDAGGGGRRSRGKMEDEMRAAKEAFIRQHQEATHEER